MYPFAIWSVYIDGSNSYAIDSGVVILEMTDEMELFVTSDSTNMGDEAVTIQIYFKILKDLDRE